MRILMTTDSVGGVWTFTKELSRELLEQNCAVALVSLGRALSADQQHWVSAQQQRWPERFLFAASDAPLEWMDDNGRAYDAAAPLLLRVAEEFGAEIVLSSQYCWGALPYPAPRVVVAHSDVLSWGDACRPEGFRPSAWLDTYRSLVTTGLGSAAAVVAPTCWMLQALQSHFRAPDRRVVIPNGRALPLLPARSPRRLQAVTAGRLWDKAKDIAMLEAVDAEIPIVVAGDHTLGDSNLGRMQHVSNRGALSESDLLNLFLESSIYICTSRYEPFGLAPLEAALCGCAVVNREIPSLREVWQDAALYFDDARSLSILLRMLQQNSALLARWRNRSRRHARRFSASGMAGAYLQLFSSLLQGWPSREAYAR